MATSDAATLYQPEQNVIAWGVGNIQDADAGTGPAQQMWEGSTKSMRKLQGGDQLVFAYLSVDQAAIFTGAIQFFCKT